MHTWSLAVEEQFYIVFPLLLWMLLTRRRSVLKGAVAAFVLASFAVSILQVRSDPAAAFFLPFARVWELGIGVVLALGMLPAPNNPRLVEAVATLGFALLLGSILLIGEATPFPGLAALPTVLGAAALLWAGQSTGPTLVARLLSTRAFVGIGLISYSLYLWHWPILVALRLLLGVLRTDAARAPNCVEHNRATLDYLRTAPSIHTVILAGRWPLSVEGERVAGEPGGRVVFQGPGGPGTDDNTAAVAFGLGETLRALTDLGKQVIVIGGIPEIGRSAPEALTLSMMLGTPVLEPPTRAAVEARQARANEIVANRVEPGRVTWLDPVPLMCDDTCRITLDGVPLYRDDDHLSTFGAHWLVERLMVGVAF